MIIPITVTQSDIFKGKLQDCELCPIALVFKRVFPKVISHVSTDLVEIDDKTMLKLPDIAKQFIRGFDTGWKTSFQPFTFNIEIAEGIAAEWGYKLAEPIIN